MTDAAGNRICLDCNRRVAFAADSICAMCRMMIDYWYLEFDQRTAHQQPDRDPATEPEGAA